VGEKVKVYLSIGSNLGFKEGNLCAAIDLIQEKGIEVKVVSSFQATEPWGFDSSNTFLNACLEVFTDYSPFELLSVLQIIESDLGRVLNTSNHTYQDRIIDIDILFYQNEVYLTNSLTIPHPKLIQRSFVLAPLAEIAPNLLHPQTKLTVLQHFNNLNS
jgi:2-amino-4-hydroxy-6-hydroxymethyldihydropteridine diphosphokinase